jgi:phosphopantothenoylcysteine decarboxylase/phosphopantothenate--cysteine ligase
VRLGQADLIIVAPATAHLLARLAHGLADDVLSALLLARTAPLLVAPAMNDEMFAHPATQANLQALRSIGVAFVGPEIGALAEGPSERPGRMSEPETIMAHAARLLRAGRLTGRTVVVTTNRSSGKMGYRVAEVAWERGADVVLISGPVALPEPTGVRMKRVDSTEELEDAVRTELPAADVLVMAAAPADYRPSSPSDSKRSRIDGALAIPMEPTIDVLHATREARKSGSVVVGFALETGDALAKGLAKLERKDLDLIVVNDALEPGAGFEKDTNRVALLGRDGTRKILPLQSKRDVAEAILDLVEQTLGR